MFRPGTSPANLAGQDERGGPRRGLTGTEQRGADRPDAHALGDPLHWSTMHGSNYQTIGTCSLCGGEVLAFVGPYFGMPPEPQCSSCGAHPARPARPVIPMERRAPTPAISIKTLGLDEFRRRMTDLSHLGWLTGDGFDRAFGS